MKILALTTNPAKADEYRVQLGLYGIRASLSIGSPDMSMEEVESWLRSRPLDGSVVFREKSDLWDGPSPLPRPYRILANEGRSVVNVSEAVCYFLDEEGRVRERHFKEVIPGRLSGLDSAVEAFDWDDVFIPDEQSQSYHEAKACPGKVSARSLVLDDVIGEFLPFRSSRAFKYGKTNRHGLVDLNHWPISPSEPISFDHLPIDFFNSNPQLANPEIAGTPIGNMLRSALEDGAHFRAAGNRREWLYWAPGINAGIPLTPKEDPSAELIYLAHDFAHYALPDLLVDTVADPLFDAALIFHRMIGETLAMVTADMFVMDAFKQSGYPADAGKHGIHDILRLAEDRELGQAHLFEDLLAAAAEGLLLGDGERLRAQLPSSPEADRAVSRFMERYQNFALADFEWTHLNLESIHAHQDRQERWISSIPEGVTEELGLKRASVFLGRIAERLRKARSARRIFQIVFKDVMAQNIRPRMQPRPPRDRNDTLSRSYKRYFVGQLALYARHPDGPALGKGAIQSSLIRPLLEPARAKALRQLVEEDLAELERTHRITPIDRSVYRSVFPIVQPHYVSYANPNYSTHGDVFDLFLPEHLKRTASPG